MAYIGKQPTVGNFQVCDAISVVNGQAAYTLQVDSSNVSPESANHMIVSLNGVIQKPGSSFTVAGSTITFASNLATGDVIDFITILGDVLNIGTPSDNTVSLTKLTASGTKDATTFLRGDNTFASAGGTSWQSSVKTSNFTAVAGEGYFVNTSGGAFEIDLPTSPSVGDQIEFVDFTRNFATANLTLDQGSNKFQGNTSPKPVYSTDGQNIKIVYSGSTQGWIPLVDDDVTLETPQTYSADFLVIAGGGSGGSLGGAGGAGGYRNSYSSEASGGGGSSETALSLSPGTQYTITIGAGASGGADNGANGSNGVDSSISGTGITTITSVGGGRGAGYSISATASSGGSGGGGNGNDADKVGGSGTANQGFDGGDGNTSNTDVGAGGGGASAQGVDVSSNAGTNGGNGLSSSITGSAVTRAGGGGGGANGAYSYPAGSAGTGGAGAGGANANGGAATANTGSGGGGGGYQGGYYLGGAGGSGVVILRLPTASYSSTTTGSPTVTTSGSDTILTFTGSGSYTA